MYIISINYVGPNTVLSEWNREESFVYKNVKPVYLVRILGLTIVLSV